MTERSIWKRGTFYSLVALLLTALWSLAGYQATSEREQIVRAKEAELGELLAAVTEQTLRRLKITEATVVAAARWIEEHPDGDPGRDASFLDLIASLRRLSDEAIELRLVDRAGRAHPVPAMPAQESGNAADRDYVLVQQDPKTRGLFIGDPVHGRITSQWILPVSYPIKGEAGRYAVVFAAVRLSRIVEPFEAQRQKPNGSVTLINAKGVTIMRTPDSAKWFGKSIAAAPDFIEHLAPKERGQYRVFGAYDGVERIVSHARVPGYPVIAVVTASMDDALALWRRNLGRTGLLMTLATAAAILFAVWYQRTVDKAARKLQGSEMRYRALAENSPLAIMVFAPDGGVLRMNRACASMWGTTLDDVRDYNLFADRQLAECGATGTLRRAFGGHDVELAPIEYDKARMQQPPGPPDKLWLRVFAYPVLGRDGKPVEVVTVLEDVTARKRAEEELRAERDLGQLYLDTVQSVMVSLDAAGTVLMINPYACNLLGYRAQELIGRHWFATCLPQPEGMTSTFPSFQRVMRGEIRIAEYMENRVLKANGEIVLIAWRNAVLHGPGGEIIGSLSAGEDITGRREAEERIHNLAFYDSLTGLPNRRLLLDRLHQSMSASARSGNRRALLFFDLDNFKTLNDTEGHDVGDKLLVEIARRLRACVRDGDTVSRLGGDEFVVLLEQLSEDLAESAAQAGLVAEKIINRISEPFALAGGAYRGTASVGITMFRGTETPIEDLLKRADVAMYQAKEVGRNTWRFFEPAMQEKIAARAALTGDLQKALHDGEFLLWYQPQFDAGGGCFGAEALVRWRSPRRGLVLPGEFIGLAEETGLIHPLGRWVLQAACVQLAAWRGDPILGELSLAINVSPNQFKHKDFVAETARLIELSGAPPERIKLELTESLLLDDVDATRGKMDELRKLGVSFSLDDFGTGYSSLSYLKQLPFEQVKIDRSFVRDVLVDPNDAAICRAIVVLGRSLGLRIIAEGVETEAQWTLLRAEGCGQAQGYLFGKPMPADEFERWARAGR